MKRCEVCRCPAAVFREEDDGAESGWPAVVPHFYCRLHAPASGPLRELAAPGQSWRGWFIDCLRWWSSFD